MQIFVDFPYWIEALFAAVRVTLCFILLFGFIAPLFLSHIRELPIIEKLIYSWIGLGGVIIFAVFVLSVLHLYDFIGMMLTLTLIPVIINYLRSDESNVLQYLKQWELRTIVSHLQVIEEEGRAIWNWLKTKFTIKKEWDWKRTTRVSAIVGIAISGGIIRSIPALEHAAPFSRGWFIHLNRIKNIRLQDYFSGSPDPGGMHSLVSVFSMLTQVSPELILHILGALSSFFLCIIIYWSTKDMIKNRYPLAPIFGMAIYALAPMLLMPVSLDQQIEASSLDLALCFAFPTMTIFVRNIRSAFKSPWFYVLSGFVATAMVNLFVAFVILLPLMLLGLASLPRRRYLQSLYRVTSYLLTMTVVVITPYLLACYVYDVRVPTFLLSQLYSIQAYSYYPFLVLPLDELSSVYMIIAGGLCIFYLISAMIDKKKFHDEVTFLITFLVLSLPYTSFVDISNIIWLDIDQLNAFYAVMIAMFAGILVAAVLEMVDMVFNVSKQGLLICSWILLFSTMGYLIFMQKGVKISRSNPNTVPDGFLKAYYQIINTRLPYSYATVGPKIQRILAKNRDYFMEYEFFLNEYSAIDSLYRQQLQLPEIERTIEEVPPASIFVLTEKPPYNSIQQGILYDSPSVMRDVEEWLAKYKQLPGRQVEVFYSDSTTTVYEIINRQNESNIEDVLYNIYPSEDRKNLFYE
ncbi:hypothetical protein [Fodinibius salsisoli]|uniref:Uncharacterized protein n=1 Tax=Fodinibius salsisoli TaxID=2820877 RepID=A0ABT3PR24_9BACT|nr:hypothetical protein [Fodinibius salsisoli]MCW9708308.1 hypothetical protein [Fodinibius salsisoli]